MSLPIAGLQEAAGSGLTPSALGSIRDLCFTSLNGA